MSGYVNCACRDCFEVAISDGNTPTLCHACKKAGCEVCPQQLEGPPTRECGCNSHECQREDACEGE